MTLTFILRDIVPTLPLAAAVAAALVAPAAPAAGQNAEAHRDSWQRVADVAAELGAVPGANVADVGAGGGYFTHRLRQLVGDAGRVYAVDISEQAVARLRHDLDGLGVRNVDVVLGEFDDPRLPFGSLDGVLIVNAYHEMTDYRAMLAGIRRALRPGGRLVILDNPPDEPSADREAQTRGHELAIDTAAAELVDASFQLVRRDPDFIADTSDDHSHRMWLLTAERPMRDPPTQRLSAAPAGPDGLFACPFPALPEAIAERLSPPDSVEIRLGPARVKVCYSQPSIRGRVIMGELVPFGEPWRLGANEATALRADRPLTVGTVLVDPGWYSLYAIPAPDAWEVIVNGLPERDGMIMDEWVRAHDVGSFTTPVESLAEPVESLTMRFELRRSGAAELVIEWERSRVRVPVSVASGPGAGPADAGEGVRIAP